MPCIIYADLEYLIKRIEGCENNLEISSATKDGDHVSCGYLMSIIWGFNHMKNKHTLYHGNHCMKKFCEALTGRATRIIRFKKKKCYR